MWTNVTDSFDCSQLSLVINGHVPLLNDVYVHARVCVCVCVCVWGIQYHFWGFMYISLLILYVVVKCGVLTLVGEIQQLQKQLLLLLFWTLHSQPTSLFLTSLWPNTTATTLKAFCAECYKYVMFWLVHAVHVTGRLEPSFPLHAMARVLMGGHKWGMREKGDHPAREGCDKGDDPARSMTLTNAMQ